MAQICRIFGEPYCRVPTASNLRRTVPPDGVYVLFHSRSGDRRRSSISRTPNRFSLDVSNSEPALVSTWSSLVVLQESSFARQRSQGRDILYELDRSKVLTFLVANSEITNVNKLPVEVHPEHRRGEDKGI
jgi:hypothetical protein